jgi:hypothetical protein
VRRTNNSASWDAGATTLARKALVWSDSPKPDISRAQNLILSTQNLPWHQNLNLSTPKPDIADGRT